MTVEPTATASVPPTSTCMSVTLRVGYTSSMSSLERYGVTIPNRPSTSPSTRPLASDPP